MKSRTGSEQGIRMVYETGTVELPKQKAKTKAKMFQDLKTKKRGRKK